MASILLFTLFCLSHLARLSSAEEEKPNQNCLASFRCGKLGEIHFPFSNKSNHGCGLYKVDCAEPDDPKIQLKDGGHWFRVENISQAGLVTVNDTELNRYLDHPGCGSGDRFALPNPSPVSNISVTSNNSTLTVFSCNKTLNFIPPRDFHARQTSCGDYDMFSTYSKVDASNLSRQCSIIHVPANPLDRTTRSFTFEIHVNARCYSCFFGNGQCLANEENEYYCSNAQKDEKRKLKLGLGLGIPLAVLMCLVIGFFVGRVYMKKRKALLSRNISDQYGNSDPEADSVYYGIPLFSYKDLEEATNNFNSENELGDGGFGTVYHGVLKDGREVAVKRLYEHNYKRLEQFLNEIEILTRLRHQHLVTLYGCTSQRSRDLLLVYEYIPNGTVADHLHGDRAVSGPLSWPVRLRIALDTASALSYLHASDTVHRDVKTTNVLLDNNFSVKVADFGLSRLFPNDVTHVSTAPQGTPGYVDPDYHQCYQLTSKSDVYSFGVVLVELVSSMPAVDITRHRHEINLSNLAISKIRNRAYGELVDPRLGFDSDEDVRRSVIAVAELAFQCLQQDKEMRPTMDEVLEELKKISGGGTVARPPPSPECDEACLLKKNKSVFDKEEEPPSPNTVTENWPSSRSITPNIST